ncbi:hypothetical protein [Streptomyces scabiei]|uniref:hypothetical protein n=1 Tax=Streptomyces scabiei TaxID=1930 RepID=UPI0029B3C8B8|nr:hypothetical protein [Streptomyces scabiei]MDX2793993.1 hypothetical protein [Streptomyces scabiei]
MLRRTHSRRNLLMLASTPGLVCIDDPGAGGGGGGGGGTTVNEHGFPDNTPVADMSSEHQAAYWKHHARKHEQRANSAPDAAEVQRLKERDAALKKIEDDKLSADERAAQERQTLTQERDTANSSVSALTDENARLKVALKKGLTFEQAERLRGTTPEELEADADTLLTLFGNSSGGDGQGGGNSGGAPRSGGARGSDVGNAGSVSAGAERFRQKHGK